jgi:dephospho-CoA kinase
MKSRLIGVAGTLGAGKDTAASIFTDNYGYIHLSTGDAIRSEAMSRFGRVDRDTLHQVANSLRVAQGAGVLCLKAIETYDSSVISLKEGNGLVVSGIRAIAEAQVIKNRGGLLLFVDAPIEMRYARLLARNREGEITTSLEAFQAFEARELETASDTGQDINGVRKLSHLVLYNDGDRMQFTGQLEQILYDFLPPARSA